MIYHEGKDIVFEFLIYMYFKDGIKTTECTVGQTDNSEHKPW